MEGAICRVVEKIIAIDPDCINLFNFSLVFFFLRSFIVAEEECAVSEENCDVVAKVKVLRSFIVAEPEFAVSEENSDVQVLLLLCSSIVAEPEFAVSVELVLEERTVLLPFDSSVFLKWDLLCDSADQELK
ncbi:hypothetical protein LINPERHAP1_LOCUS40044 [Linum perenne]